MSRLKVFGDSQLVIRQLLSLYEVRKPELIPYHKYALKLITSLDCVTLEHVPRRENKQADALANLASTLASYSEEINVLVCQRWVIPPLSHDIEEKEQVGVVSVYEIEREDWRQPLIDYLRHGKLPNDLHHKTEVRRRASRFIYFQGTLYRRSFEGIFLRYLREEEATKALEETHSGICGAHQSGLSNEDNVRLRLEELEALDEKRLEAQQRLECYQARLCRAFNKKVRPRSFQEGDLVFAVRRPIIMSKRMGNKFLSKWDGPYVVQEVYTNGAYKIVDENGLRIVVKEWSFGYVCLYPYASLSSVSNLRRLSFHKILGPSVGEAVVADADTGAAAISSLLYQCLLSCVMSSLCACIYGGSGQVVCAVH
ncbi:hypothetical protein DKX38_024098 [Salix brachista]|uniref:RNase H type-1 domain-containing protein n=1 Tax=Salix brachista TaxID=2182728 RepID=A0A5N5JKH3_9ROSI|nr:hypothetical protein DKX38_024098 [Salix brachista]